METGGMEKETSVIPFIPLIFRQKGDYMPFKRFEEIPVWKAARELVRDVYVATRQAAFSRDTGLCDQIQRAAVSITSNIAEGHERGTTPDLIQYLFYAKGSCGEVRSQLYNAEDVGYLSVLEGRRLREASADISRQIHAWIARMQTVGFRQGPKYHKEPDHSYENFLRKTGFERMKDGRVRKIGADENGQVDGTTGNGTTENGMTEDGIRENGMTEDGNAESGMVNS